MSRDINRKEGWENERCGLDPTQPDGESAIDSDLPPAAGMNAIAAMPRSSRMDAMVAHLVRRLVIEVIDAFRN